MARTMNPKSSEIKISKADNSKLSEPGSHSELKSEIKGWGIVLIASIVASLLISIFYRLSFTDVLRVIWGFVYVLFIPGHAAVRCFFKELDWIEKAALSTGLSIVFVTLSVMFSNIVFGIPITSLTNFFVILAVIVIILLIKICQKPLTVVFRIIFRIPWFVGFKQICGVWKKISTKTKQKNNKK